MSGPSNIVLGAILDQPRPGAMPSQAVLDRIADRSITGGYRTGKRNRCPQCFTARSANGTCSCE